MLEHSSTHSLGNDLGGMIALSDLMTALAYFVIPVALGRFLYVQRDLKFKHVLVLFILFIIACGSQHLLHFTSRWWPAPRLLTAVMAFMAAISVVTAVMIWPALRQISQFLRERAELQLALAQRNRELESALLLANERKLAQEQSERTTRRVISDAPIGMAVVSLEGRFTLVNRSLCDILGYKAKELEKLTFQEITAPEDLDSDLFQVGLLLDGMSESYRIEKRYICRNGEHVHVQLDVSLVRDEKEKPSFFIAQIQDITSSKKIQEALRESTHRFHTLLKNLPTAVVVHRPDSSIEYANPAASELLGLSEDQLAGKMAVDPHWHFLTEDGSEMALDDYPVMRVISSKQALTNYMTGIISSKDAPARWLLVNSFPLKSASGKLDKVIVSFIDITQRKALQQALEEQAHTDALTGLYNRRYFQQVASRELAQARRTGAALSLVALDLDHFKNINDRYGHAIGDRVLKEFSDIIREVTRENDIASRLGGEEFIVLMPGTDIEEAFLVAERLRLKVVASDKVIVDGHIVNWTTSAGVAIATPADISIDNVVERADKALYCAKSGGRNRVVKSV